MADERFVEFTAKFTAVNKEEADLLLEALFEAVDDIVCQTDQVEPRICSNCHGTLVNPPDDPDEEPIDPDLEQEGNWAPGAPCAVCVDSDHPGVEYPCQRDHFESAVINPDASWFDGEDRRHKAFLTNVLLTWDVEGPEAARTLLENSFRDILRVEREIAGAPLDED